MPKKLHYSNTRIRSICFIGSLDQTSTSNWGFLASLCYKLCIAVLQIKTPTQKTNARKFANINKFYEGWKVERKDKDVEWTLCNTWCSEKWLILEVFTFRPNLGMLLGVFGRFAPTYMVGCNQYVRFLQEHFNLWRRPTRIICNSRSSWNLSCYNSIRSEDLQENLSKKQVEINSISSV